MLRIAKALETALRTAVGLLILPAAFFLASTVALLLAALGVPTTRLHWIYASVAWLCLRIGGTRLEVAGEEVARGAYIVVSNHESMWDAPCVVAGLPELILRFVAKREVMRIPVFGQALRLTGNVSVTRSKTAGDVDRLRQGMGERAPEVSMLFFAEGTRSRDGALQPFKMGAFATALASGLPILPVALAGTYAIWPKGSLRLRRARVVMVIGQPVPLGDLGLEDRAGLRDKVHHTVSNLRDRARELLRAQGCEPGGIE
ncbi:MAG: lysophospholipid acyltransferase family protein [Myxococcota bacterium]